jgi:hypothetical protein
MTDLERTLERGKNGLSNQTGNRDKDKCTKAPMLDELYHELRQLEESVTTLSNIKNNKKVSKTEKLSEKIDLLDKKIDTVLSAVTLLLDRENSKWIYPNSTSPIITC